MRPVGRRALLGLGALWVVACTQLRPPVAPATTSTVTVEAGSPAPAGSPTEPPIRAASPQPTAPPAAPVSPLPAVVPAEGLPAGVPGGLGPAPTLTPIPLSPAPSPAPSVTPTPLVGVPITVVARLAAMQETRELARLLTLAGLETTLSGSGPFTVFAPTDAAFAALPRGDLAALEREENRAQLRGILTHHVVAGSFPAASLIDQRFTSLAALSLPITTVGGAKRVGGAGVVTADLAAGNGLVHTLDAVLMPPDLTPVATTVVDVVNANPDLTVLEQALAASGLVPTPLRETGPFTLFAPTDKAFDAPALPPGTAARLLEPGNQATLAALLRFHLVRGRYRSGDLPRMDSLPSELLGPPPGGGAPYGIKLEVVDGAQRVGGRRVLLPDSFAFNGVVHVIDGVLLPPGFVLP